MRKFLVFTLALLSLTAWAASGAYAQGNNASLGGVVMDTSKALIPGVTVTLTNTQTGVVDTRLTNDSGAFQFPSVQPGTYKLTGDLTGFSPATQDNLQLGTSAQVRINLTLQVGAGKGETVQVNVPVESRINETSSSVGEVLSRDRIENLPLVGNNVLDLLVVLPGFRESAAGAGFDTVGGLGLNTVNATINGVSSNSTRNSAELWGYQAFSTTVMNPDLVGEIRLILAPVDAELGRGNAQVQIQTRSGTNKYTGAGVWDVQNTALNANTWLNNHTPTLVNGVVVSGKTTPDWRNINQLTGSFGGPIIKNKTFFFFLFDKQLANSRTQATTSVLTDAARQGIYRYFPGWNPGNAAFANPTVFTGTASTTGTFQSVDALGNPLPVSALRDPATGGAYTGQLTCFSIFGNVLADGVTPITQSVKDQYCPGGNFVTPNAGTTWDAKRARPESTGYIQRVLALAPHANNFSIQGTGDGLNTAANRYLRGTKGSNTTNAIIGVVTSAGDYNNRDQTNLKIDHNINKNNRVSVAWTYQREDGSGSATAFQNGFQGNTRARTNTLAINGTSTLTASLVNESRFGWNGTNRGQQPAWSNPNNPATTAAARSFLLTGGPDIYSGKNLPVIFNPGANVNGFMDFASFDLDASNPIWDYADTMRWTLGKHSLSFGGEYRRPLTTGYNSSAYPTAGLGNFNGFAATNPVLSATTTSFTNTGGDTSGTTVGLLPGLLATSRTNATGLNYLFYGSVASVNTPYWINSQADIKTGNWRDTTTQPDLITNTGDPNFSHQTRGQVGNEWSFFFKDDYKVLKHLTLNLGVRYDITLSAYLRQGLTNNFVGDGAGMYGAGRPTSGDLLANWLRPGGLFLTGYGSNGGTVAGTTFGNGLGAASPVQCQLGVTQTPLAPTDGGPVTSLPTSTCDPNLLSTIQFIGPGTANPKQNLVPVHGKFSPAIGFAWQIPWFGEGKTTMRGGYQRTYGGAGAAFSGGALSGPGGDGTTPSAANVDLTQPALANILATRALNIEDIALLIPVAPVRKPGQPIPTAARGTSPANGMYSPDYITPYTDNFTLSVTRNIGRNYTLDARFIDTLGRKQPATVNLNTDNIYDNPQLLHALDVTRAGGNDPLFDQMLMGLNIDGTAGVAPAGYNGVVGSTVTFTPAGGSPVQIQQRGSAQLRRSATFSANIANGNYIPVIDSLMSLVPGGITSGGVTTGTLEPLPTNVDPTTGLAPNPAQRLLRNGCNRIADGKTAGFVISDPTDPNFGQTVLPQCFPENFVYTNPQLGTANLIKNMKHSNYQSGQIQLTARPIQGVSIQSTFSLSKTMSTTSSTAGTFTNPLYPELDYGPSYNNIGKEFRTNGTFEVPIGPNKLLLGNSSGWIARAVEKWQASVILTIPQGSIRNVTGPAAGNFIYDNVRPDIVGPWTNPRGEVSWNGGPSTNFFGGTTSAYGTYKDPQCNNPVGGVAPSRSFLPAVAGTDITGYNLSAQCTLTGLGLIVPLGTPNAITNAAGTAAFLPLLANPKPGTQGNIGVGTMRSLSKRRLDGNISKRFRITESKSLQFRMDATNILNHPNENDPTGVDQITNALATNAFGQITGKATNSRTFQAQLRLSF